MAAPTDFTFEIIPDSERLPDDSLNLARFQRGCLDLPYELLGELGSKMAALDAAMTSLLDADGGSVHLMLQIMGRVVGQQLTGRSLTVHELLAVYGTVPRINEKFEFMVARNVARLVGVESLNYKSLTRPKLWVQTLLYEIYDVPLLPSTDMSGHNVIMQRARKYTDVFKPNPDNGADLILVYYKEDIKSVVCALYQIKDVAKMKTGSIKRAYDKLLRVQAAIEVYLTTCVPYINNLQHCEVKFGYCLIASGEVDLLEVAACPGLNYTDSTNFSDNTFTAAEAVIYKKVRGPKVE